jgi:imidazolonepropionase-like amidohydrolase
MNTMKEKESRPIVLQGGRIIDGTGSEPFIGSLEIDHGKINMVCPHAEATIVPENAEVIDVTGLTILPGLIDTHTHIAMTKGDTELSGIKETVPFKTLKAYRNAEITLEAGFTTIRDLGADNLIDLAVRDGINQGIIKGPRMLVSGFRILPTGADYPLYPPQVNFSERFTMDSPDEVRKAVRTLLALGVDVIKILTSGRTFRKSSSPDSYALNLAEATVAVEEAHNQGIPVSCHAHGSKGVKIALAAGCDTLEHGTTLDEEDIELMVKKGTWLIPTFSYGKKIEQKGSDSGLPDFIQQKALASRRKRLVSFKKALEGGVRFAMGSDAGMPLADHGKNSFEFRAMVEAGLSPMQAIMSGTSYAAECLGLGDKTGTLEAGKYADIVSIEGNPLDNMELLQDLQKIRFVMKEGQFAVRK